MMKNNKEKLTPYIKGIIDGRYYQGWDIGKYIIDNYGEIDNKQLIKNILHSCELVTDEYIEELFKEE